MRTALFSLLLVLLLGTCDRAQPTQTTTEADVPPVATAAATDLITYPSISRERMEYIFENGTYLDATFYNLPVSINQSELAQIRSTLGTISTAPVELSASCQPIGRIWLQVNGKNVEEADIYFSEDCYGYVWMENGKPAYSNKMTEEGIRFYANIFQSVQTNTGVQ